MFILGLLIVVGLLLASILVENERYWSTLIYLAVCIGVAEYFDQIKLIHFIRTEPLEALKYFVLYFAAGLVWSTLKWTHYLFKFKEVYRKVRQDFETHLEWITQHRASRLKSVYDSEGAQTNETPAEVYSKEKFKEWLKSRSLSDRQERYTRDLRNLTKPNPTHAEHRTRLMGWIGYWPFSLLAFAFKEPVRLAYDVAKVGYNKLSSQILASTDLD